MKTSFIRKGLAMFTVAICALAIMMAFVPSAYALTYYDWTWFNTEDGKWDKTIKTTSSDPHVQIYIDVSDSYKDNLSVRLCSASTGNCTAYKSFGPLDVPYPMAQFTNMIPATYYVDIRDNISGSSVSGYVRAIVSDTYQ